MSYIETRIPLNLSIYALKVYDIMNTSTNWDFSTCETPKEFISVIRLLSNYGLSIKKVNSFIEPTLYKSITMNIKDNQNKKVCLAFSGGLDSVYQALYLREQNYDVYLFHIENMNAYTNGQELKVAREFAKKFNFPLTTIRFHKTGNKVWQENPFKDFLIYSACIDWCDYNDCNLISSGDDMRLSMKDSVFETNVSDSKEATSEFFKNFINIKFIPVDATVTKDKRLKYLEKFNARDYYNSCVGPGRLTKYYHNKYEIKYNVKLDAWNCASCRKCCSHIWYDYAFNNKKYPVDLLERCWDKMSVGADATFFKGKKTFEEKKKALLNY